VSITVTLASDHTGGNLSHTSLGNSIRNTLANGRSFVT